MKNFMTTLDRAGFTLHDGFTTEFLGRRGAVIFIVLFGGLIPLSSLVNGIWLALGLLIFKPSDLPITGSNLVVAIIILFAIGTIGVYIDVCEMAKKDAAQ